MSFSLLFLACSVYDTEAAKQGNLTYYGANCFMLGVYFMSQDFKITQEWTELSARYNMYQISEHIVATLAFLWLACVIIEEF